MRLKEIIEADGSAPDLVWGPDIESKGCCKCKVKKTAMITGVTGQDGSYLSEFLLNRQDYNVIGIARRSSVDTTQRIKHIIDHPNFTLIEGDITDSHNVNFWFHSYKPHEFYNLAAQSHVGTSFNQPSLTWKVNAEGVLNILESIRYYSPHTKLYQASTSEMFGKNYSISVGKHRKYQNENTPFAPQSPYAISKVAAHNSIQLYRDAYNLHASCGILFNHESERRGEQFVTRKITKWIGDFVRWKNSHKGTPNLLFSAKDGEDDIKSYIVNGPTKSEQSIHSHFPKLRLGNLEAKRDWGHARDYVRAMWLMLQQDTPDDFVISTGKSYSVKDFIIEAFDVAGIFDWRCYIVQDPEFMRPAEVDYLLGDSSKAKEKLGWQPIRGFKELVEGMVTNDIGNI